MSKFRFFLPILITLTMILLFYYTKLTTIKLYPVVVNFIFFMLFFVSNFKEKTLIQIFAEKIDGELLSGMINYTRVLNYVWSFITGINFVVSVIMLYCTNTLWALYNGCVSYIMIGLVFLIEYPIRIWYKDKLGNGK